MKLDTDLMDHEVEDEPYKGENDHVIRYLAVLMRALAEPYFSNPSLIPHFIKPVTHGFIIAQIVSHIGRPEWPTPKSSVIERVVRQLKEFKILVIGGNPIHEAEHTAKLIFAELDKMSPGIQEEVLQQAAHHMEIKF